MRLIAGLGNPGKRYINTRHNIGFRVIEELAAADHLKLKKRLFDRKMMAEISIEGEPSVLMQPLTFMNLSGGCIADYVNYRKIPLDNILVICDDINLSLGQIRIRPQGSAGGHNGLESAISRLKTEDFPRLRIGVGPGEAVDDLSDYVLSDFKKDELPEVSFAIQRAAEVCGCWVREGIDKAMSQYNS
ncbi:MAG: aminoacyl-tRNA hydrolase [Candidatus Omnitrophica bacterium]|nr:aminoacyl-tRNA hydrolase [Candidatus Omnitrophota bacterium]